MSKTAPDLEKLTKESVRKIGGLRIEQVAEREPYINALFYGGPGVGKTLLCGTAADVIEMSPVLLIDVEGGSFTLREKYPQVDVVRVQTWEDMSKVYNELFDGKTGYKTVILDSLTEIQKFSMYQIMVDLVRKEPDRDPDVPGMREWGKNTEQIRRLVRAFRDLPMNALFTALSVSERNPRTGLDHVKPALSGKLSAEVAGFVDIVAYMYTKTKNKDTGEVGRYLLTGSTETQVAKDRSDKLPLVVEEPTMHTLHTHIFTQEA